MPQHHKNRRCSVLFINSFPLSILKLSRFFRNHIVIIMKHKNISQNFLLGKIKVYVCTISVWPTQPFGPRPPLGGKKIFQKEQQLIVKKPHLSFHIELYIV